MSHEITAVERHSVAARHGLRAGDILLSINGEPLVDEIDYQALISGEALRVEIQRGGKTHAVLIDKPEGEPLGLHFGPSMRCRRVPAATTARSASSRRCRQTCGIPCMSRTTTGAIR